ncbi:site-specific integrase [Pontibacter sp. FD36]|uniref:tyrosine-type recombinase/integrase n=1 Tax=Pontibacter sp. FD36 TaxID=2789860 RepID=UPI0018A9FCA0|nr:site-specific integrase [Pontibacter sp. FD36]MBF8962164.1 site-specific integrase [Pontibacter sp. FD36]
MNIKLRLRKNKKFTSIYADIYYGFKQREYVKLGKLYPEESNPQVKQMNDEAKAKAMKFVDDFLKGNNPHAFGAKSNLTLSSDFAEYFKLYAEQKRDVGQQQYISSYNHFKNFIGSMAIKFSDLTVDLVKSYHDYLFNKALSRKHQRLSNNSALAYFEKFSAVINAGIEDKIITSNPAHHIKGRGKYKQPQRSFLSKQEIDKLKATSFEKHTMLKKAFIFSCFTGLRFGDVLSLRIKDIYSIDGEAYECSIRMGKTGEYVAIPITKKTMDYIKDEFNGKPNDKVFKGLRYSQSNVIINNWIKEAGINKHITFHNSRHSFACNLLNNNTNIVHIKNLLGHRSIKTTEIYAKSTSGKLRSAVESLDD